MGIIQLTLHPYGYPIVFETTGIRVIGTSQNRNDRAIVNDVEVKESFAEITYILMEI